MKKNFVMLICLLTAGWLSAQPLTTAQADSIVKEHNKWRAEVGVAGLTWSDELAASSQKWVDYLVKSGCRFEHSDSDYGENIFYRTTMEVALKLSFRGQKRNLITAVFRWVRITEIMVTTRR